MALPEWCQRHSLKEFMELTDLDISPNKEKKMTEIEIAEMNKQMEEMANKTVTFVQTDEDTITV